MALARWQATITDDAGNVLPAASITVRREVAGSPLAVLFSDRAGAVPMGNPFNAGLDGYAAFHVLGGAYRITATLGAVSREWRYVAVGLAQESDAIVTGLSYRFDVATADADPGEGLLRLNNAIPASATQIFISDLSLFGADLSTYLDTLDNVGDAGDRGYLMVQTNDLAGFLLCRVTGSIVDATGYKKLSITPLASSGTFDDQAGLSLQFSMRGGGLASPVAYADIQNVSATSRVLGRRTAGAGVIEECTLSQILDFIGSAAQGDILYRGASTWALLAAGSDGNVLSQASGLPSWLATGLIVTAAQATTSGTAFDFTGLPSTVKRITINFNNVSLSGTNDLLVQIGDSGGIETTGYVSSSGFTGGTTASNTSGFIARLNSAAGNLCGSMILNKLDTNTWVSSHSLATSGAAIAGGGAKALSAGPLDRVRVTRSASDTFDAGSVNIIYDY